MLFDLSYLSYLISYLFYGVDSGSVGLNTKYIGEALAARGHNVTFVALEPFYDKFFQDSDENKHSYSLIRMKYTLPNQLYNMYNELIHSVSSAALENKFDDLFYDMRDKYLPVFIITQKRLLNDSDLIAISILILLFLRVGGTHLPT